LLDAEELRGVATCDRRQLVLGSAGTAHDLQRIAGYRTTMGAPMLLDEEVVGAVVSQLRPGRRLWRGESWAELDGQRAFIQEKLDARVRLTKIEVLLRRLGVVVPYRTLHRFSVAEMGFGNRGSHSPGRRR